MQARVFCPGITRLRKLSLFSIRIPMSKPAICCLLLASAFLLVSQSPAPPADSSACPSADTTAVDSVANDKYFRLTEADYAKVAEELGIEVATMKAVVEIEAGHSHQGFVEPGLPVVNFDLTMFKRFMKKAGKSYAKHTQSTAFRHPNSRKYGSYGKAQWARLESARSIDREIADKATFWGMFQIGGFNWRNCGCRSLDEFVSRISASEAEQLELFARFCIETDLVKYLKKKDWNRFAYRYNGPNYKKRGYHTRLRKAYNKHAR